jgi:hypothetical protein
MSIKMAKYVRREPETVDAIELKVSITDLIVPGSFLVQMADGRQYFMQHDYFLAKYRPANELTSEPTNEDVARFGHQ